MSLILVKDYKYIPSSLNQDNFVATTCTQKFLKSLLNKTLHFRRMNSFITANCRLDNPEYEREPLH